jgi:two-component system phosphate regulon sensor histidine kinase PhoR
MLRSRFLWRLCATYALLVLVTTGTIWILVSRSIERDSLDEIGRELEVKARLLSQLAHPVLVGAPDPDFPGKIDRLGKAVGTRLTVIAVDGTVIADSEESPTLMENHGTRPEVLDARDRGLGEATRFSATLGRQMMYLALPVHDDGRLIGYVRASLPLTLVEKRLADLRSMVAFGALVALAVGFAIGFFFARRATGPLVSMAAVAKRIAAGDYSQRVRIDGRGEIATLADSFNSMANELESRVEAITVDRNKLLAILGGMVEGVVAVGSDDRILHINAAAGRILAVEPDKGLGRPIWEVCRVPEVSEALTETMRRGGEVRKEIRLAERLRDRTLELRSSPLKDASGEDAGAVAILHDVTEMRRLEEVRSDFVANVSHELKTPLTAMCGLLETIIDDKSMEGATRERFLGKISNQAGRLSALVRDLLTLSRVESHDPGLDAGLLDLRVVIEESVAALLSGDQAAGLTVETSLPADAVTVSGDAEALREVIDNLVSNAKRYTPAGGRIWIRLLRDDRAAVIEVQDTGIGIEPSEQGRIFERFYRVDKPRSRELGGTGLGLSIVKHITIALGGEVSLDSTPGVGSTFRVRLPLTTRPA